MLKRSGNVTDAVEEQESPSSMGEKPLKFDLRNIEIDDAPKPSPKKEAPKKAVIMKKKKPKYSQSRYKKLPPSIVINKSIVRTVNQKFLKDKEKKLQLTDCEIGEATMYMIEYYTAIDPMHPALVMMGAVMGLSLTVMELQGGADEKTD